MTPDGVTEVLLPELLAFCVTAAAGVAVLVVLLLMLVSEGVMLRLGFFANFDTCCTVLLGLPPSPAVLLVGMRLLLLESCVAASFRSGCRRKCDCEDDIAGAYVATQCTRQAGIMCVSRVTLPAAHQDICCAHEGDLFVLGID